MRKRIGDTFDPQLKSDPTTTARDLLQGSDAINDPNLGVDLSKVDVEALDKERREKEKRISELGSPEMQALKKACLEDFDAWRDRVMQRVGEVVNSKEDAAAQTRKARPADTDTEDEKKLDEAGRAHEGVTQALQKLYPPIGTGLTQLEEEKRVLVIHSTLLLLLSLESYSAHSRLLLLYLSTSLGLSIDMLTEDEAKVARGLLEAATQEMNADEETKKSAEQNAHSRKWKVGLASLGGAAIIGVTGGLAAPLLAAGVGSMMGGLGLAGTAAAGYLGALAGSGVLVGGLFGAYGGKMTGEMIDQYAREVSDFAFIPVRHHHRPRKIEKEYRRLRVAIGISGWLTQQEEVVQPWRVLGTSLEAFALRYELEAMLNLGNSIITMMKSYAWGYAKKEIIKRTIFGALSAGLWPLGLLKVSRIVDNPFSVAKARSDKAGRVLADALINRAQGERPVTLIGYSLGARVIYTCLQALAERRAFGIVESAVMLGGPLPADTVDWRRMRSVVSGRLVNVYSVNDYVLGFLYRTSSIQLGVAGLQAIQGVKGIQNVDVSDLVSGHTKYRYLTGSILKRIGFEDIDAEEVAHEERALEKMEREEKAAQEAKEKGQQGVRPDEEVEAKAMEKEVEEKSQKDYLTYAAEKMHISAEHRSVDAPVTETRSQREAAKDVLGDVASKVDADRDAIHGRNTMEETKTAEIGQGKGPRQGGGTMGDMGDSAGGASSGGFP